MTPPVTSVSRTAERAEAFASPGDASEVTVSLCRGSVAAAVLCDDRFASEWHPLARAGP
jgi:hypothetical protein